MNDIDPTTPWYRQFWPWFLIALPLTAVIGGVITIWIAVTHETGLVKENYYQDGLSINQQLKQKQQAEQAKIEATISFSEADEKITLYFGGDIAPPAAMSLQLSAAIDPDKDRQFDLTPVNPRLFQARMTSIPRGRFYLLLEPENNTWRLTGEVRLPSIEPVVISGATQN